MGRENAAYRGQGGGNFLLMAKFLEVRFGRYGVIGIDRTRTRCPSDGLTTSPASCEKAGRLERLS